MNAYLKLGNDENRSDIKNAETPDYNSTFPNTYVDQSEVVFIDRKLLWTNVFFQSRGIGALKEKNSKSSVACKTGKKAKGYLREPAIETNISPSGHGVWRWLR